MTFRSILAAIVLSGAAFLALPAASGQAEPPAIGIDIDGLNRTARPGDDFEEHANGGWRKTAEIPPDRAYAGIGLDVSDRAEQRTAELIQAAAQSAAPAGSVERKIADYHAAFMDEATIEARGLGPVRPLLDRIAALGDRRALARLLGEGMLADVDPLNATDYYTENLFGLFVAQALDDPDRHVAYLLQGGLGMPDREYYLSEDADMAALRTAYQAYIGTLLRLAEMPEPDAKAARIFALERKIAAAHAGLADTQDVHKANNPWRREDFAERAPGLDWAEYFAAAGLADAPLFIVWQPGAVTQLAALAADEPLDVWKDYLAFHALNYNSTVLPRAFDAAQFAFYGEMLDGTPQQLPRWKRAVAATSGALSDAVGQIYVRRHFTPEAKAAVETMVRDIVAAFDRRIDALDWMTPAAKAEAKEKLGALRVGIGYPERWRDYSTLEVADDDAFGNARRADLFEYRHQIGKLGKPVDREEWWMAPQVVNALNLPLQNALNFPAAILEPPFFDPEADAAANYGSIGAVIGHEISHAFDNMGAEFDAEGRLSNWWSAADQAHFKAAGARLAAQYDAYEPLPGLRIGGEQTLGENIADLAGVAAAFDAYKLSLGRSPAPVYGGLTGEQRFFLAYAQSWREKVRDAALRQQLVTDVHAPSRYRVQTVRNIEGWYDAFAVEPGAGLYLAPQERVRIW